MRRQTPDKPYKHLEDLKNCRVVIRVTEFPEWMRSEAKRLANRYHRDVDTLGPTIEANIVSISYRPPALYLGEISYSFLMSPDENGWSREMRILSKGEPIMWPLDKISKIELLNFFPDA